MKNHLAIPVKDLEESSKFYERFGFRVVTPWEEEPDLKCLLMEDESGYKIELIYHPTNKDLVFPTIPQVQHLGICVKNLEEKIVELKKEGIEVAVPITKGITVKKFALLRDPNGFAVELVEY